MDSVLHSNKLSYEMLAVNIVPVEKNIIKRWVREGGVACRG